jgi:two-component SAPR family response regulator
MKPIAGSGNCLCAKLVFDRECPVMQTALQSVLIVDRSHTSGYLLRNSLMRSDVVTHVFNAYAPALELLRRTKIETVVVEFTNDKETIEFCETVKAMHVPIVFASAPIKAKDLNLYGFVASIQAMG